MGDDYGRTIFDQRVGGFGDQFFALAVEVAGGLVKDQDFGIAKDGAGDANTLALAAGEFNATLADNRVIAVFSFYDEVVRQCGFGGLLEQFLVGVWLAVGDVFANRATEEVHILRYHGYLIAQGFLGDRFNIVAVDQYLALLRIE